uniref:Uncharacterized protein n=1 Tax=Haptolina brevifila TaxID=156173 RepID=A0A7S2BZS2_9EUKA
MEDPFLHPPNQLPLVAVQETFNTRLAAAWEALDAMYHPGEEVPKELVEGGLLGCHVTPANVLLKDWQNRDHGLQALAVPQPYNMGEYDAVLSLTKGENYGDGKAVDQKRKQEGRAQRLSVQLKNIN